MCPSTEEEIRSYIHEMIDDFRVLIEDFEELPRVPNSHNWQDPTQFEVFWIDKPIDVQMIVKTNDSNRDDKEVIINGPYSSEDFVEKAEEVLDKPRWQQPVDEDRVIVRRPSEEILTRKDAFPPVLNDLIDRIQSHVFDKESVLAGGSAITYDIWAYFIFDNIVETDFNDRQLSRAEMRLENKIQDSTSSPDDPSDEQSQDLGTFIYEPIWVGGKPERSFEEKVHDVESTEFGEKITTTVGSTTLRIFQDGFILIEDTDPKEAVEVFNTVFGTALFLGKTWFAVKRNELTSISSPPELAFSRFGNLGYPRDVLLPDRPAFSGTGGQSNSRGPARETISESEFEYILESSEEVYNDVDLREKVNFILQAYTHYMNGEHSQAFLLNWILIEHHLSHILNNHLKESKDVNNDRRSRITDSPNWYASHKIELLQISGAIDEDRYDILNDMRKQRNNIVHGMDTVDKEKSEEIMELSIELLGEAMPMETEDRIIPE